MDALTEQEREMFEAIRDESYDNFALVRSELDGEQVAVIAAVNDDDGEYRVTPVAVLVTDKIMAGLTDPTADLGS